MGLVGLEAQACGLPVLYQPVPGLSEALAASGVATDFTHSAALARDLDRLRTAPGLLPALRQARQEPPSLLRRIFRGGR